MKYVKAIGIKNSVENFLKEEGCLTKDNLKHFKKCFKKKMDMTRFCSCTFYVLQHTEHEEKIYEEYPTLQELIHIIGLENVGEVQILMPTTISLCGSGIDYDYDAIVGENQ